jgi:hypothetical protein
VDDVRHEGLHAEPRPEYYVDFRSFTLAVRPYCVVRTKGAPTDLAPTVRTLAQQLEPEAAVTFNLPTMAEIVSNSVVRPRFHTFLLTAFALAAVILAAIGIYGVMTYSIAQRTREMGIRMALGARRIEVMGLVFRQTAFLTAAGVGIGLAGAAAVTRYLEGMLFGLTPLDPATFAVVALMLAGVSALAASLPARRAARVDPLVAAAVRMIRIGVVSTFRRAAGSPAEAGHYGLHGREAALAVGFFGEQQRARSGGPRHHVSEQAHGPRGVIDAHPGLEHAPERPDRHTAEEARADHHRDKKRRHARVFACVCGEGDAVQSDQLLTQPAAGAAARNLLNQIANEGLPGTGSVCPSQEP